MRVPLVIAVFVGLAAVSDATCPQKCQESTSDVDIINCQEGCNYYTSFEDDGSGNRLEKCEKECATSHGSSDENKDALDACKRGCSVQNDLMAAKTGGDSLRKFLLGDDFMDPFNNAGDRETNDALTGLPGMIRIQMPEWVATRMNEAMEALQGKMSSMVSSGMRGKMIVVRNSPGFHEEKTFDIGPDGKLVQTSVRGDMMFNANPLDKSIDVDDVEVFDPESNNGLPADDEFESERVKLIAPILEQLGNNLAKSNEFVGPKLPETGLKSGHQGYADCQNVGNDEWGRYIRCTFKRPEPSLIWSCIFPSLLLSFMCVMYLCCKPTETKKKQKTKMADMDRLAYDDLIMNSLKAAGLAVPEKEKFDFPPSYDEVSRMKVALEPVHNISVKDLNEAKV